MRTSTTGKARAALRDHRTHEHGLSPFPSGALRRRGREGVVLPESTAGLLMLRPVGGLDQVIVRRHPQPG